MSCLKKLLIFNLFALLWPLSGCGVKGDPLPPEKPAELGRGRPTYKHATEDISVKKNRRDQKTDDEDKDDDEQ